MVAAEEHSAKPQASQAIGLMRLGIGLAQGIAIYFLAEAFDNHVWPATDPNLYGPIFVVALFVPLLVMQALGNLRPVTLIAWTCIATAGLAALTWFDVWQSGPWDWDSSTEALKAHIAPSFTLFGFTVIGLFIAQALITGADAERKFRASHATHFDVAWKLGVQTVLSLAFAGVFWGLLWLGAELFELIKLDFLSKLLDNRWFSIPATTLAYAAAIHVTDVRAGLVRGARTLGLTLLSWLVPVFALLVVGFLVALVFTGLQPLWDTHCAAGLLLFSATMLLLLINAAYQDGTEAHRPPAVLRYSSSIAACALVPVVAVAGYAIFLRVQQYGWTSERVLSAAAAGLLAFYALGYIAAAVLPGAWLKRIEAWNFYAALLVLVALLALLSPVASPMRVSVDSQIARLNSGAVDPEHFDFQYLRFQGGTYGRDALLALKVHATGPKAAYIQTTAASTLALNYPTPAGSVDETEHGLKPANIKVHPAGRTLPQSFLTQPWYGTVDEWKLPNCMKFDQTCDAVLTDLDGDGKDEVLIFDSLRGTVFKQGDNDHWLLVGNLDAPENCPAIVDAIRDGNFTLAAPAPPPWKEIDVKGRWVHVKSDEPAVPCPD